MHKITQSAIESLSEVKGETALSLYLPTHHIATPATSTEDQARYKTLLNKAMEKWESEVGVDTLKTIRAQLEDIIDDADFWKSTSKGLAFFATKDTLECFHMPIECEAYFYVGDSFDVTPLRVACSQDQPFYVLALAKHDPKLFYGDGYDIQPLDISLPESPEDALNIDEMFSGSNTVRGISTQGGGNDTFSTHGQGDTNHAGQEEHMKYLRIIDHILVTSDKVDKKVPLVLAATESEASDFKHASNYPQLLNAFVQGNHTGTSTHELHQLVWPVVAQETVLAQQQALIDRFNEDKGRQKASSDLAEIHEAAKMGKVDTLVLGIVETTNDSVSDVERVAAPLIRLQNEYATSNMCELAQEVIAQGGSIIGADPELVATPTRLAALYRY